MTLLYLSFKNLFHRPLSTLLSSILLVLGTAIIFLIINISGQVEAKFSNNLRGIDMVVGAKGSPLQLILSSVYQMDAPTGNVPLDEVNTLKRNPLVKEIIPLSFGDNYMGYRIVGTKPNYLDHYQVAFSEGKAWQNTYEVVLGARVAELTGHKIGDRFYSSHGLDHNEEHAHESAPFSVTGILKHSNSVVDNLILTDLESVWDIHGFHEHEEGEEHDHDHGPLEITSAFVKFKSPMGNITIPRMVNEKTNMQAALPSIEINRLISMIGIGAELGRVFAWFVIGLSGLSIFVSLYNSLKSRKFELAIMRVFGASPFKVFGLILLEGFILTSISVSIGFAVSRIGILYINHIQSNASLYRFVASWPTTQEWMVIVFAIAVGILASLLPAAKVYRINVSSTLSE